MSTPATIRRVSYSDILSAANAESLLSEYADECSIPELGPINPQPEIYAAMEASGALHSLGVYIGDELVGFSTVVIMMMPQYGKRICAMQTLFTARSQRYTTGFALLDAIEDHARELGCVAVLYGAPTGSRFERLMKLRRKTYRQTNTGFLRML